MPSSNDVLQGNLDLLVLKTLSLQPMHGWGISQQIQTLSQDAFAIGQGSLYPALYRLARKGLVSSEWRTSDNNREAKYYALTAAGRKALHVEVQSWKRYSDSVNLVLAANAGSL